MNEIVTILEASVTYSGISPATEYKDSVYFSGSTVYENDVMSVINHCESLGYAEEDIVIDSIISTPKELPYYDGKGANAFKVLKRSGELFKYY